MVAGMRCCHGMALYYSMTSVMHYASCGGEMHSNHLDAGGGNDELKQAINVEWLFQLCKSLPFLWYDMQAFYQSPGKVLHQGLKQICCEPLS